MRRRFSCPLAMWMVAFTLEATDLLSVGEVAKLGSVKGVDIEAIV